MARKRSSGFEDLIEMVASFPWWVGLVLAVASFFVLHIFAGLEVNQPTGIDGLGSFAGRQMFVSLAHFGQFVLPFAFGLGGLVSALKRQKRKGLYDGIQNTQGEDPLFAMTWREFEMVVGESFHRRGYQVHETGGNGADGGVDLVLTKGGEKYLVQCKQWKAYKVGVQTIRELYGVMASMRVAGGYVVTAGEFTQEAKKFAQGLNIQLLDGLNLRQMIQSVGSAQGETKPAIEPAPLTPTCPRCGKQMVKRMAKKGKQAGTEFWGCSDYPKCRGTLSI